MKRSSIVNRDGAELAAEIYRPCAPGTCDGLPAGVRPLAPNYPGVVVLHGGGSRKELHWWSAQTLAEAGYMTVSFNGAAGNRANAEDVLDWLLSTPARPAGGGRFNPHLARARPRSHRPGRSLDGRPDRERPRAGRPARQRDRRAGTVEPTSRCPRGCGRRRSSSSPTTPARRTRSACPSRTPRGPKGRARASAARNTTSYAPPASTR